MVPDLDFGVRKLLVRKVLLRLEFVASSALDPIERLVLKTVRWCSECGGTFREVEYPQA
jgi:hypothetical protein